MVYSSGHKKCLGTRFYMNNNEINVKSVLEDNVDFQAIFNLLRANKWILLAILALSISVGFYYVKHKVPLYQSDILFQVDSGNNSKGILDGMSISSHGSTSFADTQVALIKSRFILNKVVENLHLDLKVAPLRLSSWRRFFAKNVPDTKGSVVVNSFYVPHKFLNKKFVIAVEKNGCYSLYDPNGKRVIYGSSGELLKHKNISIFVQGLDAEVGSRFNLIKYSKSVIVAGLINKLKIAEERGNAGRGSTGILNMSLVGTNPKMVVDILNNAIFVARQEDSKKKALEASKTLQFLEQQLPITKRELLLAEQKLNNFRAKSGKLNLKFQSQYLLNQFLELDKHLEELKVEKVNLLKRYKPEHPVIIRLIADIESMVKQRNKLEEILKTLPESEQKDVNLFRDVEVKKSLYLMLLNKIQELEVVKAGTVSSVSILAKAVLPDEPIHVNKAPIYMVSIVVGLTIFLLLIFGRRFLSPKIVDPHWIEKALGLPTLAILPYSNNRSVGVRRSGALIAHNNPKDLTVEALRSLRTSFQVSLSTGSGNIVSILGISPGVGKSFVSTNFSYLLSLAGKKVVTIDCDLRAGTVHRYFDLESSNGLSDVLQGKIELASAIKKTMNKNLDIIPRGSFPKNPSELLMSNYFKDVLDELSNSYDIVVIDTPPILLVTDAVIVSSLSAVKYIVIGAGDHHPSELESTIKRLSGSNVQLDGYIFNFNKKQKHLNTDSYGYYYNSKYYYSSYGHYFKEEDIES